MAQLSEDQEKRAQQLHTESFVFDFSPHAEPFLLTSRQREVMLESLERGLPLRSTLSAMADARIRELEKDSSALGKIQEIWERSGVNGVQVTLGAMELALAEWEGVVADLARCYARARIGYMSVCTTAEELESSQRNGTVGLLLGLQDTLPIGRDLDRIETLYNAGVRVIQLTYNTRNLVGDGCTEREQGGLSRFGVELVRRLNDLGIIIDVSHSGYGTTMDAISVSERPIAFTHIVCRDVYDHARGKTDEQLRALAESDGYVGIAAVPHFLREGDSQSVEDMMEHLEHAASIMGVDRVGIATDWGFWSTDFPAELRAPALEEFGRLGFRPEDELKMGEALGEFVDWTDWPELTRGLVSRGFSDEDIKGFLGLNWLNFMRRSGV
jgi:membrane dipeptidase